jgi:hypothetical protein
MTGSEVSGEVKKKIEMLDTVAMLMLCAQALLVIPLTFNMFSGHDTLKEFPTLVYTAVAGNIFLVFYLTYWIKKRDELLQTILSALR